MLLNMKILQINSVYGYGSTGKIVKKIHHELLSRNDESFVIYGRKGAIGDSGKLLNDQNCYYIDNDFEIIDHVIRGTLFDKHGLYSDKNTNKIIEKIESINPDIIHLHNVHGFYINYKLFFSYLANSKRKVVWTLHDCWSFTGFCSHYEYNKCEEWKCGCDKCKFRKVYPYRLFSNSHNNFNIKNELYKELNNLIIVTPSKWLASQVEMSMLKNHRIEVINNDVNLASFYYDYDKTLIRKYRLENKIIILGVASIWTDRKGLYEYIKLSKKLNSKYQIVLIGLNKKQIKKLPKNIIGIEKTSSIDELRKWYSISNVFLNLTLEDTYPTVNLEARACGLPVITYNTGGSPETIGNHGYIIEKYDLEGVCELLKKDNFEKVVETKNNKMCDNYLSLYEELCR